ncbi:MAG: deoxyribodipyrimidine photo-lyase, partial [Polyangiaceae bacterium]
DGWQPEGARVRLAGEMTSSIAFRPDDPRVRRLNDRPLRRAGEFVLYWMQVFHRADDNAALDHAIALANELGVPCLAYEALRPDYPHASDRLHTFVLEGARDVAAGLERRGVAHAFFLPRSAPEARGVVARLARRACAVVSDDFPGFVVPAHHAAVAARASCPYLVVDDCAVVPMALLANAEVGARTIRPKIARLLDEWLRPLAEVVPRVAPPRSLDLPFEPVSVGDAGVGALVASCSVDHTVPPVESTRGGTGEAERRLLAFVRGPLRTYAIDRNDPARESTSGLSPYLHFGMISARRVALEARAWAEGESLDAFLEQLLVRRGLAYNFARTRRDHATYGALPAWARASLEAHACDPRYADLSRDELEQGRTPDALWNAAMAELRERGTIQPYARMLWGKLPLTWMRRPEDAHAAVVHLNDRWALDGRDPDGYANVSWCFGLHDRPWPERAVFGTVRTMTSASARRKLDFDAYVARWAPA